MSFIALFGVFYIQNRPRPSLCIVIYGELVVGYTVTLVWWLRALFWLMIFVQGGHQNLYLSDRQVRQHWRI